MSTPITRLLRVSTQPTRLVVPMAFGIALSTLLAACGIWFGQNPQSISVPFSADIVFYSDREGGDDIYILRTENQQLLRMTKDSGENIRPFWSPQGDKIAFYSDQDGDWDLYVMNSDGENRRNLSNNGVDDWGTMSWSPDGSQLAFDSRSNGESYEIFVADLNTSTVTPITKSEKSQGNPCWSPNGSLIAVSVDDSPGDGLVIINSEAGKATQLLEHERWVNSMGWSPDGNWIVFEAANQDGKSRIDVIKADGSQRFESISGDLGAGDPVWSAGGDWIAFIGGPKGSGESQLYIVKMDGSQLTRLVDNGAINHPAWSPDDRWIAFTGVSSKIDRRPGDLDIYAVEIDSGEIINLTPSHGDDRDPDWRPQP
jgi:Tol biopolymer transport system component